MTILITIVTIFLSIITITTIIATRIDRFRF